MIQQHGGNIGQLKDILDFSANINPLGTPDSVKKAILGSIADIEKYPDPYCRELRGKLSKHESISADNIVCGNGADDLIFRIVHALRPKKTMVCAPTFSEYSRALTEADCEICEHILTEDSGFDLDRDILPKLDSSLDMCFICNPNNPTGRLIAPEILESVAAKCSDSGIVLVCDECFIDFVSSGGRYSLQSFMNDSCIILKAFTKLFAMPDIRLGYAVCGSSALAERIQQSGQFWSVSNLAQRAGTAALDEAEYVLKTREYMAYERRFLSAELSSLGVKVFDGAANFLLFKSRKGLAEELLAEGILIRDCSNFRGLSEGFYRVAVRTHEENIRLLNAMRRCLNG